MPTQRPRVASTVDDTARRLDARDIPRWLVEHGHEQNARAIAARVPKLGPRQRELLARLKRQAIES